MGFLLAGTPFTPKKALSAGLINEVTDKESLLAVAKKYIVDGGKAVQPWDEKGFKFPGGLPGPGGATTLNGDALKAEAITEMEQLIAGLHNMEEGNSPLGFVMG